MNFTDFQFQFPLSICFYTARNRTSTTKFRIFY